jgi:hypothetical protein
MRAPFTPYPIGDQRDSAGAARSFQVAAYALTILLSAFLLFELQPIMGRIVLPWFGGSAAVWTTCMLFFQTLLLAGYLYAHLLTKCADARIGARMHAALLCASALVLPLTAGDQWKPVDGRDPTLLILGLLTNSAGLPYFMLSATSPLLQAWFAREPRAALPYRLFALSNFGSMAALLTYPTLVEPTLTVHQQTSYWSYGYGLFALACAIVAVRFGTGGGNAPEVSVARSKVSVGTLTLWVGLAFCPSALLLALTTHLTQNVAPIPLLWVLPLALYLASFILCFESLRWYRRRFWMPLFVLALVAMVAGLVDNGRILGLSAMIALYCAGLFAVAMTCHGELAGSKPPASGLTQFYLMVALGGMLGGVFVALVAPRVFNGYHELPLALLLSALLIWWARRGDPQGWLNRVRPRLRRTSLIIFVLMLAGAAAYHPVAATLESRIMMRNFYGVLRSKDWISNGEQRRMLYHGRIVHGMQFVNDPRQQWPTTYYAPQSGIGLAMRETRSRGPQHVGVVGLGTGTLAAYGNRGDCYTFYEIDPNVVDLARREFSYLADSAAAIEVQLGDARLVLDRQAPQQFDVLVIDAFSGDAIPVHLLTREAFALYSRHLDQNGVLAVNVSNRYLSLAPVVKQSAAAVGMQARVVDTYGDTSRIYYGATWVLATRSAEWFAPPSMRAARLIAQNVPVWTDDYSSIWRVVRW